LGGLDLVATLKANRPIAERGVLALSHGGVVVVTMAERLTAHTAACLCGVLDNGEVSMAREGVSIHNPCDVGIVALDEGMSADEFVPSALRDRLAFLLDLNQFSMRTLLLPLHDAAQIQAARTALGDVEMDADILQALCAAALALGAGSPRVSVLAVRAAKASAALAGRRRLTQEDAVIAARLVLAPRATIAPPSQAERPSQTEPRAQDEPPQQPPQSPPESAPESAPESEGDPQNRPDSSTDARTEENSDMSVDIDPQQIEDIVLAAAAAAIPAGLLAQLRSAAGDRLSRADSAGRVGALRNAGGRGRPAAYAPAPRERRG
jgi:magnesium chelatase subunit D